VANLSPEQLRELARLGAAARVQELRQEEAAIRAMFPDLFGGGRQARDAGEDGAAPRTTRRRRRSKMSPAARKAVSERMRRYWAERRKAKPAS
jgi:hypothetical protein